MRYCTLADLQKAIPARTLVELSSDDPEASAPDLAVLEAAVNDAEQVVDGYIRERYPVPFEQTPTLVKTWTVAIARHWLYCRRPEGADVPDAVARSYKDALKMLELVQQRKVSLGIAEGAEANQPEPAAKSVHVRAPRRKFGDLELAKYE
jgi:phage gp36-like protein